jgi:hypothetical protein
MELTVTLTVSLEKQYPFVNSTTNWVDAFNGPNVADAVVAVKPDGMEYHDTVPEGGRLGVTPAFKVPHCVNGPDEDV